METRRIVMLFLPLVVLALGAIVWLFIRKTIRTRLRTAAELRADPQMDDWMVAFNWTRKVLYFPTIVASLIAAGLMLAHEGGWMGADPRFGGVLGVVWLGMFFLNFLVEEYELNVKILLLALLTIAVALLWLTLTELLTPVVRFFESLRVEISSLGYLLLCLIFLSAIVVSWIRGLFCFVTLTPNYLNVQNGPTETSEQISRENFSTRIETSDFLERMLGFGQIIITFSDTRRQPMTLLVGAIGKRAKQLEDIRGHLSVEAVGPDHISPNA